MSIQTKNNFWWVVIAVLGGIYTSCSSIPTMSNEYFCEKDGLIIIEAEQTKLSQDWVASTNAPDYSGSGYIYWQGDQFLDESGQGEISYPIQIQTSGTYRINWRMLVGKGDDVTDHNDIWLKIKGAQIYGKKPDGHQVMPRPICETNKSFDCPNGNSTNGFFKVYGQDLKFVWQAHTSDNDGHALFVDFKKPGQYELIINARSSYCFLDKIILFHNQKWQEDFNNGFAKIKRQTSQKRQTKVSIKDDQFLINNELTYKGRFFQNNKIEGLLFNARLVQGIFDDLNPDSRNGFAYPDTKVWDADRNTNEFVAAMPSWRNHGLLSFTLNLQGGSPLGYGNKNWVNSTFDEQGNLRPAYIDRLERILDKADELGMVVILGYFYFGQDQHLKGETAVINAVDNITDWLLEKGYQNILVELNNECDIYYDHEILKPERITELIQRVQQKGIKENKLLVGTSFSGGYLPTPNVVQVSDYLLLHGNSVESPDRISEMIKKTRDMKDYKNQPILFNEDDHYEYDQPKNNLKSAIEEYASWGYFDFRKEGDEFSAGFQTVPVDWQINSKRKEDFFKKIKEITGE